MLASPNDSWPPPGAEPLHSPSVLTFLQTLKPLPPVTKVRISTEI